MKFQSIILVLFLKLIENAEVNEYIRLDKEQNEHRLANCGKEALPTPSRNKEGEKLKYKPKDKGWLLIVKFNDNKLPQIPSTGFPISKRHLLTSSQTILKASNSDIKNIRWLFGNTKFEGGSVKCVNKSRSVNVPSFILNQLKVSRGSEAIFGPVKGTILFPCDGYHYHTLYSPLLLEIKDDKYQNLNIPCIADETTDFKNGDNADSYGLKDMIMLHHKIQVENTNQDGKWVYTQKYDTTKFDRGGPLVWKQQDKSTVIALKGSSPVGKSAGGLYFFGLERLQEVLCELVGVCGNVKIAEPATEPKTTSPKPDDPKPSDPPSSKPAPSESTSSKPETPNPSTKPLPKKNVTINPDSESYYPTTVKEEKKDVDLNNDFFVGGDFDNGAHLHLSLNFLILILVLR